MNVVGLFCEDVRQEVGGTVSIVGVLPDNVSVEQWPGVMPKLGIYLRVHMNPEHNPVGLVVKLRGPSGDVLLGTIPPETIAEAKRSGLDKNQPICGIIFHAVATPWIMGEPGQLSLIFHVDGEDIVAAILNIAGPPGAESLSSQRLVDPLKGG